MVLQHNLRAMFTEKQLNVNTKEQKKSAERLSTGFKINRSADDAAGLTMSENMRSQIRGLNRATTNAEDAASFCQVADGAMGEMQEIIHRAKELCIQAANDTNTELDRGAIQQDVDAIEAEIQDITEKTEFNSMPVFNDNKEMWIQTGELEDSGVLIQKPYITLQGLGIDRIDVSSHASAAAGISICDDALWQVSDQRSNMGAYMNRFEHTVGVNGNTGENTQSAESVIRDTDMADEMVNFSRANILQQSGQAMLTQANKDTESVLRLLQG